MHVRSNGREQAQQVVVSFELDPAAAGITGVYIDGLGLRELLRLYAVFDVDLKHAHIVVEPHPWPTVHTRFIGQVFGGIRIVSGGEITEGTRDIQIAQRTEPLRDIQVRFITMTEIIANANAEQRNVLGVGFVYERWMRSERLVAIEYFMIEPRGCHQMKVLKAEHVFREQRPIGGLA